ncbi:GNAT family N-acetyltransferase [Micromonospora zamorensis]|uniref:GNAT family N-acetyltransferase n=1 Tax=Micromonospora zamorensis TaxID=709883 RepID=UPI003CF45B65
MTDAGIRSELFPPLREPGTRIGPVRPALDLPGSPDVMAVTPATRGKGIGRQLIEAAIDRARTLGATTLFLGSSTKLPNAVHLYESAGFTHVSPEEIPLPPYARADASCGWRSDGRAWRRSGPSPDPNPHHLPGRQADRPARGRRPGRHRRGWVGER